MRNFGRIGYNQKVYTGIIVPKRLFKQIRKFAEENGFYDYHAAEQGQKRFDPLIADITKKVAEENQKRNWGMFCIKYGRRMFFRELAASFGLPGRDPEGDPYFYDMKKSGELYLYNPDQPPKFDTIYTWGNKHGLDKYGRG